MVLSLIVKTFLLQPFHIPSGSMEDTLIKDDRVVVGKLTPVSYTHLTLRTNREV